MSVEVSRHESLGSALREAWLTWKSQTALVELDRRRTLRRLRYLDVRRQALPVMAALARAGVGPGVRVAVLMPNQARWIVGAYAALHLGATLVPLDYKLSAAEQQTLLRHSGAAVLLTEEPIARRLALDGLALALVTDAPGAPVGRPLPPPAVRWDELAPTDDEPPVAPRRRDDVAVIVYSSGTGGRIKGCMLTHDAYLEQYAGLSRLYPMGPGDRFFSVLPTNHAIDFMCGFLGPALGGATVIHQRTMRPETLRATMQAERPTHMAVVPLLLEAFERALDERLRETPRWARRALDALAAVNLALTERRPSHELSRRLLAPVHAAFGGALRHLFAGGAFVDRARAERFYRLGLPVSIGYGLTEACTVVTVNDLRPFRADSVGRPVPGVEVRIDAPGADGVGEVLVRGRTVMKGYLDDPELTAETLDAAGWLHTGDLGRLDASGHLQLRGRRKNVFVTPGGKNVYPEDVEGAFEGIDVEELVVLASNAVWPGARLDEEFLFAVVRPKEGCDAQVREALRERNGRLPEHKRVRGLLWWSEAFPRTASLKVRREALAESIRARVGRDAVVRP
ncbi:MAG: AMP-binding protein [Myxococcota bacterium]|nr:AMP-binding protein [Myxococcota bacterium]